MIVLIDSLAIVCLILAWWVAISSYPRLPERIPVHFGLSGEADSWGGRWMIFLMPVIATLIAGLDWFIFSQLRDSPKMPAVMELPLHLLMLELTALFAYITCVAVTTHWGRLRTPSSTVNLQKNFIVRR